MPKISATHKNKTMHTHLPDSFAKKAFVHAYAFISSDKDTRTLCALEGAMAILCKSAQDGKAFCGECAGCKKILSGTHPDVHIIGCNTKKVGVNDIRCIESEAYLSPNEADAKVFILENADTYNPQSQNALLKIIEEPPENVYFILTVSSKHALLPTVASRLCIVNFGQKSLDDIKRIIKETMPEQSDSFIEKCAYYAAFYDRADIKTLDRDTLMAAFDDGCALFSTSGKTNINFPKTRDGLMIYLQVFMLISHQILHTKQTGCTKCGILSQTDLITCCERTSKIKAASLYDTFEKAYLLADANANINALCANLLSTV